MKYANIIKAFCGTEWLIEPGKLEAIAEFLVMKADGRIAAAGVSGDRAGARSSGVQSAGSIGIISIVGIFESRMSMLGDISSPGMSAQGVGQKFDEMLRNPDVAAIVLDIESPGGTVLGIPELSEKIYAARGQKPIVAHSGYAGSAGYYIASAAEKLFVSPSGEVGSVGVYAVHVDESKANELEGLKYTIISAGKYKVEGNPTEPLADEARANIQLRVDNRYEQFVRDVARNRKTTASAVKKDFGDGRMLLAKDAEKAGMVDGIKTFEQAVMYASEMANGRKWKGDKAQAVTQFKASAGKDKIDSDHKAAAGETIALK